MSEVEGSTKTSNDADRSDLRMGRALILLAVLVIIGGVVLMNSWNNQREELQRGAQQSPSAGTPAIQHKD